MADDCKSLAKCAFFLEYESDKARTLALKGFVRKYCKGPQQEECVRKKIKAAHGIELVPVNMMPNGSPLRGTNRSDWSDKITAFL